MSADLWTWCEWTPDIAARELLTGPGGIDNATHWALAMKIREAIIHGALPAERRSRKVWFVDHHEELTDHYSAPAEVIRWAIHAGVDVPQSYLDWYRTHAPQDEPAHGDKTTGQGATICRQAALIAHVEPVMRIPGKLPGLLSNAAKNGLSACRAPGGWNLGEVARWLLLNGYLRAEVSERHIESTITKAFDNS